MRTLFNRMFARGQLPSLPIATDEPICVIGDIHGRLDCLQHLLSQLETTAPHAQQVFVGDYIDRGSQSAEVLSFLKDRHQTQAKPPICLLGNHEEMMLNFLRFPQEDGNRWLRHGGLQTMVSFGITNLSENNESTALLAARDSLLRNIDPTLVTWLEELPRWWQTGNLAVVHAGADPSLEMPKQTERSLTWGHPDFGVKQRQDGLWVAHGHTIVEAALCKKGVLSVDTGAYITGRLTGALIEDGEMSFLASRCAAG
jgi:serine/threonine protein phosphatase 1